MAVGRGPRQRPVLRRRQLLLHCVHHAPPVQVTHLHQHLRARHYDNQSESMAGAAHHVELLYAMGAGRKGRKQHTDLHDMAWTHLFQVQVGFM